MLKETGERQVKQKLIAVDFDHRMRYNFAASLISSHARIADIGCGIGYGSYYMACATDCSSVVGIDIAEEAIQYAQSCYKHPNVDFVTRNITEDAVDDLGKFDIITAFEVVEHVQDSNIFLKAITSLLNEDGIVAFTTPNEEVIPFNKEAFRFHVRHYTQSDIIDLIEAAGLELIHHFSQNGTVVYGFPGNAFHVLVCRKRHSSVMIGNGTALENSLLYQRMAATERIAWLLEHAPVKNVGEQMLELKLQAVCEDEIRRDLVMRKDAYLRKYAPHTLADNPNFVNITDMLQVGDVVMQEFESNMSGLCGIAVLPALYCMQFNGLVVLSLYNEDNDLCALATFTEMYDNESIMMRFAPQKNSAGQKYRLEIYLADLESGSKLSFYQTQQRDNSRLYLNDRQLNNTLTYRAYYY